MCTGWSGCPITKYSGLSDGTYIDLVLTGSYVTVLYWAAQLISLVSADSGSSGSSSMFSGVFIAERLVE
jgi:hypothetical protein